MTPANDGNTLLELFSCFVLIFVFRVGVVGFLGVSVALSGRLGSLVALLGSFLVGFRGARVAKSSVLQQ